MTYASPDGAPSPGALRTAAIGRVLFSSVFVATVLAALLVPITITALAGTPGEAGPLMKNVALFGGLLQLAAASRAARAMEES